MQDHKLKFHSSCFFKFSNFCKISRAPAISLQSGSKFPSCSGKYYFADLRMTFRQNFFLQEWFRNKLGVGLG